MATLSRVLQLLDNRHVVRAVATAIAIVLIVFAVQSVRKGLRSKEAGFQDWQQLPAASRSGNDLTVYLEMAAALKAGQDPTCNFYPPFASMAFLPLLALPVAAAHAVWYAVNVACLFATAWIIARHAGYSARPLDSRLVLAFAGMFILMLGVLQNHWLNGQINLLAVLCCALFFHWHCEGKAARAALALALAICFKVSPVLLLGFLVFRGSWRTLALTLGWFVALNLLPLAMLGEAALPALTGLANRLLGSFEGRSAIVDKTMFFTISGFFHWVAEALGWLRPGQSHAALKLLGGLLVMVGLCVSEWRRTRTDGSGNNLAAWAAYLLAMLLLLPVSETHHLVFALPAVLLLMLRLWQTPPQQRQAATIAWLFVVAATLLIGRADRNGPWYFLAVLTLFAYFLSARDGVFVKQHTPVEVPTTPRFSTAPLRRAG